MSGHTKGPWYAVGREVRGAGSWTIAQCFHTPDGAVERDARLIAAAPDGLAFAEAHDAYMLDAGYSGPDDAALHPKAAENWRQCRAFIARATEAQP